VKRVAIVAASEEMASALAAALRASPQFEVVAIADSMAGVPATADMVVVARPTLSTRSVGAVHAHVSTDTPALTDRERDILALLADGLGNKQIAARLGISTSTVKTHLELLFEKLDATSRTEAVATAVRLGLLFL
jgi:DNA-binding NarL/FixJ family response regulator